MGFGDVLGPACNSREEEFVNPNLPENNPTRKAFFTAPYPDTAMPGLSLITAQAPIYYTGTFEGIVYNDTYIASTGVDISVTSMSTLLQELEGTLTNGSFAFVVDGDFHMCLISQATVNKVCPERTGMEETRVAYDLTDGSIINDRRNQTYMVSDTVLQDPTSLTNANWKGFHNQLLHTEAGGRGFAPIAITLTGDTHATSFQAFWDRWDCVADWYVVVFVPQEELKMATQPRVSPDKVAIQVMKGEEVPMETTFHNDGDLDLTFAVSSVPSWVTPQFSMNQAVVIQAKQKQVFQFIMDTSLMEPGVTSSLITVSVNDHDYPDCFFSRDLNLQVSAQVLLEEDMHQLGNTFRIFSHILTVIVLVTSFGFSIWVHRNRENRVLRASQPIFLLMLTLGTAVMGFSIIPLGMDDSSMDEDGCDIACVAFPWLITLGFSITFSALFSKIWRVNQLLKASTSFKRVTVSERDVLVPFAIILFLNVTLLLLMTLLDPPHWQRIQTSETDSSGTCWRHDSKESKVILILLAVVNLAAVLLANIQAFKARAISDEYAESRYIGVAMAGMLQVCLVGVPVLFLVEANPPAFFLVLSSIIFLVSMSLLLLIFVPKVWLVRHDKAHPQLSRRASSQGVSRQYSGLSVPSLVS